MWGLPSVFALRSQKSRLSPVHLLQPEQPRFCSVGEKEDLAALNKGTKALPWKKVPY